MIRVGFYQFHPLFGRVKKNLSRVTAALKNVSADIIVLPELAFSGYYFKNRQEVGDLAEEAAKSATVATLVDLCKFKDFYIVTGFAEKENDKYFNSALLLGPEGLIHTYRKIHLFNEENSWFDPGENPLEVHTVRGVQLGMMVCFDWIFPEVVRSLALLGAEVIGQVQLSGGACLNTEGGAVQFQCAFHTQVLAHQKTLTVVIIYAGKVQTERGVAGEGPGGVAGKYVDLARLQRRETLLGSKGGKLDFLGIPKHRGGHSPAGIDVQARPVALVVRAGETRQTRGHTTLQKSLLFYGIKCGTCEGGGGNRCAKCQRGSG